MSQSKENFAPKQTREIKRIDSERFTKDMEAVIKESEEMRINRMMQHRSRGFISLNANIAIALLFTAVAGYLFLMQGDVILALVVILVSFVPMIALNIWSGRPVKTYTKEHKTVFMPKLAATLNGLQFYPERGVSEKIISKLAVVPAYDTYEAEDCFMGTYKGVKVIFSEARLYRKDHKDGPIFDGIFVLLETAEDVFEGHTIITSNHKMVKNYETTRWKSLKRTHISVANPDWDKFYVYSSNPEAAELFVGDRLLKELAEAGSIFDNAELTAVLFGKKHVFMMIPYEKDMFEASNLFVPVTTKAQAMQVKKEIEQLLEIVDVFDLYEPLKK